MPLRPAPDRRSLRRLDFARSSRPLAKRLPLHLIARWTVDETWATVRQPTAHSRRRRIPSSAAIWMLDPSALAPAKEGQTLPRLVRRLGAYDVTTPRGRGSEEFGPLETIHINRGRIHLPRLESRGRDTMRLSSNPACGDLVSDNCTCGFEVIASLGRRRTSTVKEETARLNVVLDIAHDSVESSRRRRPCEAKRNKAIGRGDRRAILVARLSSFFTALAHWEHAADCENCVN